MYLDNEALDYTIRIGSTPTCLYFDLYLYSAYAAHYVKFQIMLNENSSATGCKRHAEPSVI